MFVFVIFWFLSLLFTFQEHDQARFKNVHVVLKQKESIFSASMCSKFYDAVSFEYFDTGKLKFYIRKIKDF